MSKKLYRSRKEKILGGVCGGLAEYLEIDVSIIRVVYLLLLFSGIGFIIYIIMWIVVPYKPYSKVNDVEYVSSETTEALSEETINKRAKSLGYIIIAVGLILFLESVVPSLSYQRLLPLLIIGVGLLIIFNRRE